MNIQLLTPFLIPLVPVSLTLFRDTPVFPREVDNGRDEERKSYGGVDNVV